MPAAPPERPKLRDRYDRRRLEVLTAAARVFAERGYDGTSISELAGAMGVATGGIYHYFSSKEELLAQICDATMDPLLERCEDLVRAELAPEEHLRAFVALWVRQVIERRDHMLVFQQKRHVVESGEAWGAVRARRKAFERLLEDAVEHVDLAGRLAVADRRVAVSALLGMVNHTAQWYRLGGRLSPEAIAEGYADLVLAR